MLEAIAFGASIMAMVCTYIHIQKDRKRKKALIEKHRIMWEQRKKLDEELRKERIARRYPRPRGFQTPDGSKLYPGGPKKD